MLKRLIIPLDGSRLSEAVLPTAAHLAPKLNGIVMLVHVIERNAPKRVHGEPHLSEPAEAEAYLADVQRRFFPPEVPVERHVHATAIADVAQAIVDHAREFSSDVVLMSTHGRGGLRKLLFGTIAQQVVAHKVPVLLVRPTESGSAAPPPSGKTVLAPVDTTELSQGALETATALARACGAPLKLLMVVPTLGTLSGVENPTRILLPTTTQAVLAFEKSDAEELLRKSLDRVQAQGVSASAEVRRGDPAEAIVAAARQLDVDFVVMGTHGKAGMDAFWSGSVAPKVSDRTHLPLLLVPAQQ